MPGRDAGGTTSAAAVDDRTLWVTRLTPDDYAKAEARGVLVSPEGALGLGPADRLELRTTAWR